MAGGGVMVTAELLLTYFFEAFIEMYIDNKGWFRLAWHKYIGGDRPQRDIEATNKELNKHLSEIWKELYDAERILHNSHCYIVGEISNYLLGRGLIENETC